MAGYQNIKVPNGEKIKILADGKIQVPDHPIVNFIEGDGTGPDIWAASVRVIDAAVQKAYSGKKKIAWCEVYAGQKATKVCGEFLPQETVDAMREFVVSIKGPLETPIGGGIRSLNVTLRQDLDLYSCVRPCKWYEGVPAPVKEPQKVNMTIFRENTEDVYSGIEYASGTPEAQQFIDLIQKLSKKTVRAGSAIGIKPMSPFGSKRLVKMAIEHAIEHKLPSVTLVHKGNIMKFTEGGFKTWGYEVAKEHFSGVTITEEELWAKHDGKVPAGKIVIKDRIADNMFQQILLRPEDYAVLALPNLNGDYISDALAAQVGGLGIAPGANIGKGLAVFEATHGTAPKYAGQDKVNPGSVILSGMMMLEYMGWKEAATLIEKGLQAAITKKRVTYDFHRAMEGATLLKCSEFGTEIISNM